MLDVESLIAHAKGKGINFDIMSERDAIEYLSQNNNYFKLSSYRKNYPKITNGPRKGQYNNLDFAHLVELARIDVEIRHLLIKMCLDIEHFLKVSLIKAVENNMKAGTGEDGYKIVTDFLIDSYTENFAERAANISRRSGTVSKKVRQNQKNPYCEGLINKYQNEMPIWAFVEVISFGDLEDLITFYADATGWALPIDRKSLDRVRQIRNAAAHNNCIINDLNACSEKVKTPGFITQFVSSAGIGQNTRAKKLSNRRINQLVHLLYVYDRVVTSKNTRTIRMEELRSLINTRLTLHKYYFQSNSLLTSTYDFFKKLVVNISADG